MKCLDWTTILGTKSQHLLFPEVPRQPCAAPGKHHQVLLAHLLALLVNELQLNCTLQCSSLCVNVPHCSLGQILKGTAYQCSKYEETGLLSGLRAAPEHKERWSCAWAPCQRKHHHDQEKKIKLTTDNTNQSSNITVSWEETHKFQQNLKENLKNTQCCNH